MKTQHYCWLFLLLSGISLGQDRTVFTRDKEFYLKGNATVIGNSIIGKNKSKAFDKLDKVNDEFKMRYIDIDQDAGTFSSSSAYFSIPDNATIKYATLQWTATYYGERSGERVSGEAVVYKKLEERAHNPQTIKMRLNVGAYKDITGTLVYDGGNAKNKTIKSRAPYAYTADVTKLLKGYYQGNITVANIPATQGKMNGGSAGGWLLYVVYEDDTQPFQYITTYYGLESIKKEAVHIDFGSFKSSEDGELSTTVTLGALEGDTNLDKDQVRIYNPKSDLFLPFGNRSRPANNFFTSAITSGDDMVLARKPNSKNTLGFDIAQLTIDAELNNTLTHSSQGVQMQFSTRGDHYFLFFAAFQTTISEDFFNKKTSDQKAIVEEPSLEEVAVQQKYIEEKERVTQQQKDTLNIAAVDQASQEREIVFSEELVEIIDKDAIRVPNLSSGFYIISNVFSSSENAQKWERTLRSKDLFSNTFFRPDNNLYYVSLGNNTDPLIMYELLKNIRKNQELSKSWILKINM